MAQGFPVIFPQRLWTTAGVVTDGWKITTYAAGTSTPINTWSNPTLTSLNTNPIIAGSSGYFRCYVAAGTFIKVAVTDENDVPQPDLNEDNLEPMVDPGSSSPSVTAVPTGGIVAYGAAAAPTGFLLCDGTAVSRITYATLFGVISTTYGAGNGSTTFNLPDLRGRFPLGLATAGTGSVLGGTGGTIDHTHTGPSHTHAVTVTRDGWSFAQVTPGTAGRLQTGTGADVNITQANNDVTITSAAGGTGATGTANAPFQAVTYIIKT